MPSNDQTQRMLRVQEGLKQSETVSNIEARFTEVDIPLGSGVVDENGKFDPTATEELLLKVVRSKNRPVNRAHNSVYYCKENAMLWTEVLEKVARDNKAEYIAAKVVGCSRHTLYMRAQYGFKWLAERHPIEEQRKHFAEIRLKVKVAKLFNEVQDGIMILSRVTARSMGSVGVALSEEETAKLIAEEKNKNKLRWRGLLLEWYSGAKPGDVFSYPSKPEDKFDEHKFKKEDEIWLLELAQVMEISDYKMDMEENSLVVER